MGETDRMSDTPASEQFDGTEDDVVMPDDVRAAAEARGAAALAKYGDKADADKDG